MIVMMTMMMEEVIAAAKGPEIVVLFIKETIVTLQEMGEAPVWMQMVGKCATTDGIDNNCVSELLLVFINLIFYLFIKKNVFQLKLTIQ